MDADVWGKKLNESVEKNLMKFTPCYANNEPYYMCCLLFTRAYTQMICFSNPYRRRQDWDKEVNLISWS